MGCHFLLQRIFWIQESNPGRLLHCRQILYQLSYEGYSLKEVLFHKINPLYLCSWRNRKSLWSKLFESYLESLYTSYKVHLSVVFSWLKYSILIWKIHYNWYLPIALPSRSVCLNKLSKTKNGCLSRKRRGKMKLTEKSKCCNIKSFPMVIHWKRFHKQLQRDTIYCSISFTAGNSNTKTALWSPPACSLSLNNSKIKC